MSEASTTRQSPSDRMALSEFSLESPRWLHVILMVVAIAAWMIFILACIGGPAWSPDGTQILFTYRDVAHSRNSAALYDRKTDRVTLIFSQPAEKADEIGIEPEWQSDGTRALLTLYHTGSNNESCELLSIPVKSQLPLQAYSLGSTDGCMGPHPQIGNRIFFGGNRLRWIDLATGSTESKTFGDDLLLVSQSGEQISYVRAVSRVSPHGEGEPPKEKGWEFGHIDISDMSLKLGFTVWLSEIPSLSKMVDELPQPFWNHEGSRFALISNSTKDEHRTSVAFFDGVKGYDRSLTPDFGGREALLGNLVWSRDGSSLYASALVKTDQPAVSEYCLAEIPLDGTRARLTQLASMHTPKDGDPDATFVFGMQVSLSPAADLIAATPAVLEKESLDARDRALFLINVRDHSRHIQRIPLPDSPPDPLVKGNK